MNKLSKSQKVKYQEITFSNQQLEILVELADTAEKRQKGLTGIDFLGTNEGMLFDFQHDTYPTMWMKECLINLDAAFIDNQGHIVYIVKMLAKEPNIQHRCEEPIRYVLEVVSGFFQYHNIGVGDKMLVK